jgi:hypothetical protein
MATNLVNKTVQTLILFAYKVYTYTVRDYLNLGESKSFNIDSVLDRRLDGSEL